MISRSLHWERGLKRQHMALLDNCIMSLPSLGAWIETLYSDIASGTSSRSLHWERGLKLDPGRQYANPNVAPFIGSVD